MEVGREAESRPAGSGLVPQDRQVHILREGREVDTDEDKPGAGSVKHALGEASRGALRCYAIKCGADEAGIDLFMSLDLRGCHLVGNVEERRFMAGTYRRICMPEVEFLLSNKLVDNLTTDVEVAGIRALLLARNVRLCHGHIETELQEKAAALEKSESDLKASNKGACSGG